MQDGNAGGLASAFMPVERGHTDDTRRNSSVGIWPVNIDGVPGGKGHVRADTGAL